MAVSPGRTRALLQHWASRNTAEIIIALGSIGYALWAWGIYGWRPGVFQAAGYLSWFDQRSYVAETASLARFALPSIHSYQYGLGYPIVGVPFYWMGFTADPLLIPDLLLLACGLILTYRLTIALTGRRLLAAVVVGVLVIASPLIGLTIVPWSTSVTLVCVVGAMLIATRPFSTRGAITMGLLMGWAFSARYLDLVLVAFIAVYYVVLAVRSRPVAALVGVGAPAAAVAALVAISQWLVFGSPFRTPYGSHLDPTTGASDQSAANYRLVWIPKHFIETFVTGFDYSAGMRSDHDPLLFITPLLILLPLGAALVLWRGASRRALHITFLVGTIVQGSIYLAFRAGGGRDLHFNNARYWIASYPYWLILSVLAAAWIAQRLVSASGKTEARPSP